jgi:hypothetical protein
MCALTNFDALSSPGSVYRLAKRVAASLKLTLSRGMGYHDAAGSSVQTEAEAGGFAGELGGFPGRKTVFIMHHKSASKKLNLFKGVGIDISQRCALAAAARDTGPSCYSNKPMIACR